jgi:site-specific DNA recombinase
MTRRGLLPAHADAAAQPTAAIYLRVSTKEQAERGGEAEGFSIPAQREACRRKAEQLGAEVVEEFIDAGESARSADRPSLQQLLDYVVDTGVDYVIVHKVDRLARNRYDDAVITARLQAAGAQLVSVTENIDQTPSGLLLHGIMSSIAEFYSRNLANEVIKGTQQKVSAGGTPHIAPLGYRNVRHLIDGREVRTVEVDPERAAHLTWAFAAYAGGDYSLRQLSRALADRGLTQRPTPKRAARPLPANKLHAVLRNRYYVGYVTWRGVEYQGKHPTFIDADTFQRVQAVLEAHRLAGERSYKHGHYLAGSLYCGRCRSRLLFGVNRGRRGDTYEYFFCAGRHSGRTSCDLPWLPLEQVETAVQRQWDSETMPVGLAEAFRQQLRLDLGTLIERTTAERDRLTQLIARIRRERYKWADNAMDGAVPADIAREKQQQLANQLLSAESSLERLSRTEDDHQVTLEAVLALLEHCGRAYRLSDEAGRRDYNQAWFDRLLLDADDDEDRRPTVAGVAHSPVMRALRQAEQVHGLTANDAREPKSRRGGSPDGVSDVRGSNYELLVELRGLEPLTPTLPGRHDRVRRSAPPCTSRP